MFAWQPDRQYDLVFFSFWLSHVPPERLASFLATVNRAVRPGGRVFLINSRFEQTSTAKDAPLRDDEHIYRTRKLNDGSKFTIVKVFYEPDDLRAHFERSRIQRRRADYRPLFYLRKRHKGAENPMQYRDFGRTGWKVSEISFGAWAIGIGVGTRRR